jgi:methyltransferase-like protein/SAM-dependent methyltransferase
MSHESAPTNPYDLVPYPSRPVAYSHPDHLAAVATLFGLRPQPIDGCRVLELGCATGGNLIPMAERHPHSTFLGVDSSRRQIAAGRQAADVLGLKNLELRDLALADVDDEVGLFDYIICHGVFSWVAFDDQEKILEICKSHLRPEGVAYVSYNSYPGWHLRSTVRDLIRGYTPEDQPPRQRIARGRKLLEFLAGVLADDPAPYSRLLKDEIDETLRQPDDYLVHEHLEKHNSPLYFHEFAARATGHGLQYLSDVSPGAMFASNFGPLVEQNLKRIAADMVSTEQHLDLLRNRAFREALVCHDQLPLHHDLRSARLGGLYLAGDIRPRSAAPDLKSGALEQFALSRAAVVWSPSPTVKAAFCHLGAQWPRSVSFDELVVAAAAGLGRASDPASISSEDQDVLRRDLIECLIQGLIEIRGGPDCFVTTISPRPVATRGARLEAAAGTLVTNRRHQVVALDEAGQNILQYLDGQHDRAAMLRLLVEAVDRGRLSILVGGIPAVDGRCVLGILEKTLDQRLALFASSALLVA